MYNDQINGSNENYLKIMMKKFARQKENLQELFWWLTDKKKSPLANAGDIGLIPDPGRSHVWQSN